jgi:hypothetical protein
MFPLRWLLGRGKGRRRTEGPQDACRQHGLAPELRVRLGFRRLEDRRVLDVSAAFWTATGQLDLQLSAAGDQVTMESDQGQLTLSDQHEQPISIRVDGGAGGAVAVGDVRSVFVRGTSDPQQGLTLRTDLQLTTGLHVDANVEFTVLAADLETAGGGLQFGSELLLERTSQLSGDWIDFARGVNSQVNMVHDLYLDAGTGGIQFRQDIGGTTPLGRLVVANSAGVVRFGDALDAATQRVVRSTRGIELGRDGAVGGIDFTGDANSAWTMATTGDDIRLNGPVTVRGGLTITTGSDRPGDLLWTRAATLDSPAGEPGRGRVTLDAGTGTIAFHADLGAAAELGRLTVLRAEGGLYFGEGAFPDEVGTVSRIAAAEGIELATGTGAWDGPGVTFNGGTLGTTLQTRSAEIVFHDSVTLAADVTFLTAGGDVRFSPDSPIDSRLLPADQPRDLTFDLGAGEVRFNEDLGLAGPLGSLRVRSAAGVWFGESTAERPAEEPPLPGLPSAWLPMGSGPVEQIRTVGTIDLGVDQRIVGSGIVFVGGATTGTTVRTTQGDMRFHGPVELANTVRLASSAGNVRFTSEATVDSRADRVAGLQLDLQSGRVFLNANVGSIRPLDHLTVSRAGGGLIVGESSVAVGTEAGPVSLIRTSQRIDLGSLEPLGGVGVQLQGPEDGLLLIESLAGDVRIDGPTLLESDVRISTAAGGGKIALTRNATVDAAAEAYAWSLDAGTGQIELQGHVGTRARPDAQVTPGEIVLQASGGITLGTLGGWEMNAEQVRFESPVILQAAVEIDAEQIRFVETVDSRSGELHRLTVSTVEFLAPVGSLQPLGQLHVDGIEAHLLAHQTLHVERLQVDDARVDLLGAVTTFSADQPGVDLTGSEMLFHDLTTTGEGSVRIESQDELRLVGDWNLTGSVWVRTRGRMTFASATVETAGRSIELTADAIALSGPVRWSSAAAGNLLGADLRIAGSIVPESAVTAPFELHMAGGERGAIRFESAIQGTGGEDRIRIESAGDVTFAEAVELGQIEQLRGTGTTRFSAALRTDAPAHAGIELASANLIFAAPVTTVGQGDVRLVVSERLTIEPNAAFLVANHFQQSGGGQVRLAAPITSQAGEIRFADDVQLLNDLWLRADGVAGQIIWGGRLDGTGSGGQKLSLSSATGKIEFLGSVGQQTSLGAIEVLQADDLRFASAVRAASLQQVAGTGTTLIQGSMTLTGPDGARIQTVSIGLEDRLQLTSAIAPIDWFADQEMRFLAPLVTNAGAVRLVTTGEVQFGSTGAIQSTGGDVQIETRNVAGSQTARGILMRDGAVIESGAGRITLHAVGDVQIGQLVTTTQLDLRSFQGAITDGGDQGDADLIGQSARLDARDGIGTENPLDTRLVQLAAQNEGSGGIRLENRRMTGDRSLLITTLDGLSGLTSGPAQAAAADHRGGPIEIINLGRLEVAAPVLNHAGDHTRLRAEQAYLPNGTERSSASRDDVMTPQARIDNPTGIPPSAIQNSPTSNSSVTNALIRDSVVTDSLAADSGAGRADEGWVFTNNEWAQGEAAAVASADLILRQPVQNRGGSGWIFLFAAQDLVIEDSLPELVDGDRSRPYPEAEVSVVGEGAIRGQAGGEVHVAQGDSHYVILRTHAERFANPQTIPALPTKFQDPAAFPALEEDPDFYIELEQALAAIRDSVSPQFTNVAPILEIQSIDQGGSNVDEKGRVILEIKIGDPAHVERNFAITVDWGDGQIENYTVPGQPQASRNFILNSGTRTNRRPDGTITGILVSGEYPLEQTHQPLADPGVYYLHHTYAEPPRPDDPAQPIPIRVELRFDARAQGDSVLDVGLPPAGSGVFHGVRFFRNTSEEIFTSVAGIMTNPGQGAFQFIKVVKSEIVPVERREIAPQALTTATVMSLENARSESEVISTRVEDEQVQGYRLFFVLVDDVRDQELPQRYEVPFDALADPVELFTRRYRFPNGHYRLYLEDLRTRRDRLILDINIYEGRAVPPDFRDNAVEGLPAPSPATLPQLDANGPGERLPNSPAPAANSPSTNSVNSNLGTSDSGDSASGETNSSSRHAKPGDASRANSIERNPQRLDFDSRDFNRVESDTNRDRSAASHRANSNRETGWAAWSNKRSRDRVDHARSRIQEPTDNERLTQVSDLHSPLSVAAVTAFESHHLLRTNDRPLVAIKASVNLESAAAFPAVQPESQCSSSSLSGAWDEEGLARSDAWLDAALIVTAGSLSSKRPGQERDEFPSVPRFHAAARILRRLRARG